MKQALLIAVTVLTVAGGALAWASGPYGRRIATETSSGDYAAAAVSANARRPHALYVKVTTRPPQGVSGNWSLTCSRGGGAGSKSGEFSGDAPLVRRMRFPMRRPRS